MQWFKRPFTRSRIYRELSEEIQQPLAAVLFVTVFVSGHLPVRRAASIEPQALRTE